MKILKIPTLGVLVLSATFSAQQARAVDDSAADHAMTAGTVGAAVGVMTTLSGLAGETSNQGQVEAKKGDIKVLEKMSRNGAPKQLGDAKHIQSLITKEQKDLAELEKRLGHSKSVVTVGKTLGVTGSLLTVGGAISRGLDQNSASLTDEEKTRIAFSMIPATAALGPAGQELMELEEKVTRSGLKYLEPHQLTISPTAEELADLKKFKALARRYKGAFGLTAGAVGAAVYYGFTAETSRPDWEKAKEEAKPTAAATAVSGGIAYGAHKLISKEENKVNGMYAAASVLEREGGAKNIALAQDLRKAAKELGSSAGRQGVLNGLKAVRGLAGAVAVANGIVTVNRFGSAEAKGLSGVCALGGSEEQSIGQKSVVSCESLFDKSLTKDAAQVTMADGNDKSPGVALIGSVGADSR